MLGICFFDLALMFDLCSGRGCGSLVVWFGHCYWDSANGFVIPAF